MRRPRFFSLRLKLLCLFTALFGVALAVVWTWVNHYATEMALSNLRRDLMATALTAAAGIDGDLHARLIREGRMDDETYAALAGWLRSIKRITPKAAGIYTYYQPADEGDRVRFGVSAALPPGVAPSREDVALADAIQKDCVNTSGRPALGQGYGSGDGLTSAMLAGLGAASSDPRITRDQWGAWLSGYAPIYDQAGRPVGAVGVDMCASDVARVEQDVRRHLGLAFGLTLALLIGAVTLLAYGITRPVIELTHVADQIGHGNYDQPIPAPRARWFRDEVAMLAQVFALMVSKVRTREESLRHQVAELRIIIDEGNRRKQVEEITDTDFFRDLEQRAAGLRQRRGDRS